jgi:hypothetical protein
MMMFLQEKHIERWLDIVGVIRTTPAPLFRVELVAVVSVPDHRLLVRRKET